MFFSFLKYNLFFYFLILIISIEKCLRNLTEQKSHCYIDTGETNIKRVKKFHITILLYQGGNKSRLLFLDLEQTFKGISVLFIKWKPIFLFLLILN